MTDIQKLDSEYIANTYSRNPITVTCGKGSVVYDENKKKYIDLSSGIAVNTLGIADEGWVSAVCTQAKKLAHMSNLYYTEPCALLAKELCERTGMKKVFFSNSGAEANECAIKAARKYAAETLGSEYFTIVTMKNSFHGRTLTTLAATGQDVFHKDFLPLTEGFVYAEAGNAEELERLCTENRCAAVMLECIQGEGGVMPLGGEYVAAVEKICRAHGMLLICDEVQCGNGRSGMLYSYMNYGIRPDIVTTAKGLSGGLPLGATLLGERVKDVFTPGSHGSTFGGNPVCCAAALYVLSKLDAALLESVREKEKYIRASLEGAPGVKSVSGMGLMLGIETEKDAGEVIAECMRRGVLVIKAKNKVRLLPALNIPAAELEYAIGILKEVCAADCKEA